MLELGLFVIGAVFILIALIMLFRRLYPYNRIGALLALIFVVPLLIYALIKFSEPANRKAIYVFVVGILAMLVGISGGALAKLPFLPDHAVVHTIEETIAPAKDTPLPNEEAAQAVDLSEDEDYDPLLSGGEFETIEPEDIAPPPQAAPARPLTSAVTYQKVERAQLEHALNKPVRVKLNSGAIVDGTLTHVNELAVVIESQVSGGSLGLSHTFDDIQSIAVRGKLEIPKATELDKNSNKDLPLSIDEALNLPENTSTDAPENTLDNTQESIQESANQLIDQASETATDLSE